MQSTEQNLCQHEPKTSCVRNRTNMEQCEFMLETAASARNLRACFLVNETVSADRKSVV